MNKQQLASKIWESANRMRSKIEANEYKDYILGFIFYKFLSDKEEEWLLERQYRPEDIRDYVNEDDPETVQATQQGLGYFIAYKDLFSTWIGLGADFSVDHVRTALSSFSRLISGSHKKVFEGIFATLETGLSKLGDSTKTQTKAVTDLIHLIKDIPTGKKNYDVLGHIYEYLIEQFASNAGKKAGEFYTPHEVSLLMSEIIADHLKGREALTIYDPTSGSGSLLINIGLAAAKYLEDENRIRYYAQEYKSNTYNLTRMNLVMRGILPDNIVTRNGDTLEDDWPYFDEADPQGTYNPLYVDAVVSNPPYSQRWNPDGKETDARYARYGIAPVSKADYAFLLHDLYHLKPDGIMTIVLPHGVLFRGGEEGNIRRNLIEQNNIDAIIGLPANIFFGTGIPTIIMVLRQKREHTDVLIVDASKGFAKEGKNNKLRASDIRRITDTVVGRREIARYSRRISREEIRANDYNLNIPRYVDSSEPAVARDLYASMFGGIPQAEIDGLASYWEVFPTLKGALFTGEGAYKGLSSEAIAKIIAENKDVKAYREQFALRFADYKEALTAVLIDRAEALSIPRTKEDLTVDLFERFEGVPLLDPYEAYESFAKAYDEPIAGDLELIQAEGMAAVRQVDPNMVVKKRRGQDVELQEGWKGHILPFDLVQKELLADDLKALDEQAGRLRAIPDELSELVDELSEDEKESLGEALNEDGDALVMRQVKPLLKELKKDPEANLLVEKLERAEALSAEERELKAAVKQAEADLHLQTKAVLEGLSDEQAKQLLVAKWIVPILEAVEGLPEQLLKDLAAQVKGLADKYAVVLGDIEKEIRETEAELCAMLGDLTGSEADMAGIRELQRLLGGEIHG